MLDLQSLEKLPRTVLIEVVYLVGRRLTHRFSLEGQVGNRALDGDDEELAKAAACAVIQQVEGSRGAIDELDPARRSDLVNELHAFLRNHIGHAGRVRDRASAKLNELEAA